MWSCCHHTLLRAARCLCADPPDKPCSTPLMKCLVSFDLVSLMKCLVSLTWSHWWNAWSLLTWSPWWNVWSLWLGLTDEMLGLPDQPYVTEDVSFHLLPAMKTSMWHCLVSALCKWHTHVCTHTWLAISTGKLKMLGTDLSDTALALACSSLFMKCLASLKTWAASRTSCTFSWWPEMSNSSCCNRHRTHSDKSGLQL